MSTREYASIAPCRLLPCLCPSSHPPLPSGIMPRKVIFRAGFLREHLVPVGLCVGPGRPQRARCDPATCARTLAKPENQSAQRIVKGWKSNRMACVRMNGVKYPAADRGGRHMPWRLLGLRPAVGELKLGVELSMDERPMKQR